VPHALPKFLLHILCIT